MKIKNSIILFTFIILFSLMLAGCNQSDKTKDKHEHTHVSDIEETNDLDFDKNTEDSWEGFPLFPDKTTDNIHKDEENKPDEELIFQDIIISLEKKNSNASIKSKELIKSLTEPNSFSATYTIHAETKYADWQYEVKLDYTKYDQGWMIDQVHWNSGIYTQERFPNAQELTNIAIQNKRLTNYYSDLLDINNAEVNVSTINNTNYVYLNWISVKNLLHANQCVDCSTCWIYNNETDSWDLYPVNDEYLKTHYSSPTPKNVDFSGTWNSGSYSITISNFTLDNMNFYSSLLDDETHTFYKIFASDFPNNTNVDTCYTNGNGAYLGFAYHETLTTIVVYDSSDEYGYVGFFSITDELPELI